MSKVRKLNTTLSRRGLTLRQKKIAIPLLKPALFAVLLLVPRTTAHAEVRLAKIFTNHMVVQRERPVRIWGWASVGEDVRINFRGETQLVTASETGHWEATFQPGSAGGPYTVDISGTNHLTLQDVLVGDVWIASGQSNMAMPMGGFTPELQIKDAPKEIAAAEHPQLRFLNIAENRSTYPLDDVQTSHGWQACSSSTIKAFSAVAYFFARDLQVVEKVPVGVVVAAWGGTPIEAWTSMHALASEPALMPLLELSYQMSKKQADNIRLIEEEAKADAALRKSGKQIPSHPDRQRLLSWQPSVLFNGMIAPLTNLPVKGIIWYQGESNTDRDRAGFYAKNFGAMITDWRQNWHEPYLPFLYVQISSLARIEPSSWSVVRESQRRQLKLAQTAMVVSADIGDPKNVHPSNKQEVGRRLALAARSVVYGETIEYSGPTWRNLSITGNRVTIWFEHASGLRSMDDTVIGFEVAGSDRKFVTASAKIAGDTVIITSPDVKQPVYVRYAWSPSARLSLINSSGLPASPFSTDDGYDTNAQLAD